MKKFAAKMALKNAVKEPEEAAEEKDEHVDVKKKKKKKQKSPPNDREVSRDRQSTSKSPFKFFKRKKKDESSGTSGASGTSGTDDNDEDDDEDAAAAHAGLVMMRPDKKFGQQTYVDADRNATWHVLVRVIEGRDLSPGYLRVRAQLEGHGQKVTRVSTQATPKWRQNLMFTIKDISLQSLSNEMISIKLTRPQRFRDDVLGLFTAHLAAVIHSESRSVISKWIALRAPTDDDDDETVVENCGFLKVTIAVYGGNDSPPRINDDEESEEIWSGAQLTDYTLRIRIFRLLQLTDELVDFLKRQNEKNFKKKYKLVVKVVIGDKEAEVLPEELSGHTIGGIELTAVNFDQELYIPIQWPTVISKIRFYLYMVKGKSRRCLAQTSIPLRAIYEPGDEGFMPTFGPTCVSFYGHEVIQSLKWFKEKQVITEGEGSRYISRMLVAVDCAEYLGEDVARGTLDYSSINSSKASEALDFYDLMCSFDSCNKISPLYASESLSFAVSMGAFGSTSFSHIKNKSSTLGAMPEDDDCKYFSMPWGNHKPMAEVPCLWEDVLARFYRANALSKAVSMLKEMIDQVRSVGETNYEEVASIALEAVDHLEAMLERLINQTVKQQTILDQEWNETRNRTLKWLLGEISDYKYEQMERYESSTEIVLRILQRAHDTMARMAKDVQLSWPMITIKMLAGPKVVGYCQIPANEVFFHRSEAICGQWCSRLRAIPMQWPTLVDRKNRHEEFPAVVHVMMWLGRRADVKAWRDTIMPAEMKAYAEMFAFVKRPLLSKEWSEWDGGFNIIGREERFGVDDIKDTFFGWKYSGNWCIRTTQELFLTGEGDRPTIDDKVYEVQQRTNDKTWKRYMFTDYYGVLKDAARMQTAAQGWEYIDSWTPDEHMNHGDKQGFVYAMSEEFWKDGVIEVEERAAHRYRRRCIRRRRKALNYNREDEDVEKFIEKLDGKKWEFAGKNEHAAFHSQEFPEDRVKRWRFLREIELNVETKHDIRGTALFYPRIFEVHNTVNMWQLRCYLLWAKDLLPIVKNSSCAFVRVTFQRKAKMSLVVQNSQNPVFNETLIFDRVLIAGSVNHIKADPPMVLVEVRGERKDDSEISLGSFEAAPSVTFLSSDRKAGHQWHTLHFSKGKTRGALLACFELYPMEEKQNNDHLPLIPATKEGQKRRYEVPGELRPKFATFTIQFLCWGVRSLSKYHLLSVKSPFVEVIMADVEMRTVALKDVTKNPNWSQPLLTLPDVSLPEALELSPPLVINLYDKRAFKREPLVGVCHIGNFSKYIRKQSKNKDVEYKPDWEKYDAVLEAEEKILSATPEYATLREEGKPRLDWWSKYYTSLKIFQKAPGYVESGLELLSVFPRSLEESNGYNHFNDFLDTFPFVKSAKGNYDDPEEKEKVGELKGKLFITKHTATKIEPLSPPGVEFVGPTPCVVRVYVVEARGLTTMRKNGVIDPYLLVRCGKQKKNLKKNYRADTVEPIFGECIEFDCTIPLEKDLTIAVMDKKTILADEELGSTTIDLENRLLTKWRGTAGFSRQYTIQGEIQWRDQQSPLNALKRYCTKMLLQPPEIVKKDKDVGIKMLENTFWHSDVLEKIRKEEEKFLLSTAKATEAATPKEKSSEDRIAEPKDRPKGESKLAGGDATQEIRNTGKGDVSINPDKVSQEMLQKRRAKQPNIKGTPIQTVALFILHKMNLVPEHVETRQLRSPLGQNLTTGELRVFVDILPKILGPIPAALDISPREPDRYQLRVAVLNVSNAIPIKRSFGQPVSDLYVKVFVNGVLKPDSTDIHFRTKDGCGEFNWRFLLDVNYNPWERRLHAYQKTRLFRKAHDELVDPLLIVQLWDKNKIKKDKMLGEMVFDMLSFPEGISDPEEIPMYAKPRGSRRCKCCTRAGCCYICLRFCWDTRCCCKIRKTKKLPFPKAPIYKEPGADVQHVSLFETETVRGWWPVITDNVSEEHKEDIRARKKKDDDYEEGGQEERVRYVMGLIEMEMALVPLAEAEAEPVGKKRKEPNHSPFLPKPHRNFMNHFWITSRIGPCISWGWSKFGKQCLCWILTLLILGVLIYALVMNWPTVVNFIVQLFKK